MRTNWNVCLSSVNRRDYRYVRFAFPLFTCFNLFVLLLQMFECIPYSGPGLVVVVLTFRPTTSASL